LSAARQIPVPYRGGTPDETRTSSSFRELARSLVADGAFLARHAIGKILRPGSAHGTAARWGEMNRVLLSGDSSVALPRIEPRWIGTPLVVSKMSTTGNVSFFAPSRNAQGGFPNIDGAPTRSIAVPGLYTFITDGKDWYSHGAETLRLFDVRLFGASPLASGAVNTAAFQAAFDAASSVWLTTGVVQTVYVPAGVFKLLLDAAAWWTMPLNGSTTEFHGAIKLRSGVNLIAEDGARYVPVPPAGANSAWYYGIFASEENHLTVGDLEQIRFTAANFDFSDTYWPTALPTIYGIVAVGVYDLGVTDPVATCTGTRNGRLGRIMNCEEVDVTGIRAENVTQVLYMAYCRRMNFTGSVDGFNEAFDIDQSSWDMSCDIVARNSGGEGQVLDVGSVQDGFFRVKCDTVGQPVAMYTKPECWLAYSDWVTNFPLGSAGWSPDPVFCKRVTLELDGQNITHATDLRTVQLGLDRSDAVWGTYWDNKDVMCEDITLRIKAKNCTPVLVYECKGLDADISLDTVETGAVARVNGAAVILRQARTGAQTIIDSKLSGRVRIKVKDSTRTGVRISCPTALDIEAIDVDGYNSAQDATSGIASGVWIEDLALKTGPEPISIANIRVKNGDTTVDPTDIRLTWDGAADPTYVRDMGGHQCHTGAPATQVMRVALFGYFLGAVDVKVTWDTVTNANHTIYLAPVNAPGARLAAAHLIPDAAIAGNAVDFSDATMRRVRAGVVGGAIGAATNYDNVARAAGSVTECGVNGADADGVFLNGDFVAIRFTRHGVGSTGSAWVRFTMVEHAL
jgi:hypothetical protein